MARARNAAASTDPAGAAAARVETEEQDAARAAAWQGAVAGLVDAATDVLRARNAAPAAEALQGLDLTAVERAERELRGLRGLLRDYADELAPVAEDEERVLRAASALRLLLEGIAGKALALPGEDGREPPEPSAALDEGLAAAGELLRTDGGEPQPQPEGGAEPEGYTWSITNLTARPIELADAEGTRWVVPAYGARTFDRDPRRLLDLRRAEAAGEISVRGEPRPAPAQYAVLVGVYVYLVPAGFVGQGFIGLWAWALVALVAVSLPGVVALTQKNRVERLRNLAAAMPGSALQAMTYLTVVLIALFLPALALVFGADLRSELRSLAALEATPEEYLTIVGRTMQLALIAIASVLPALLYFQFDRDRMSTLREKFVHQIFRLDPTMRTKGAVDAKYGVLIDETYGPERAGGYRRLPPGRRAPIFVATLLIMLGWLYVLMNPDVAAVRDEGALADLFQPRRSTVAFAFLGAYFFTLFALLRGYVRRDLRPKSYTDISVRILTVAILAWTLELGFDPSNQLLAFAFVAGIVPQAALNRIRELTQAFPWPGRPSGGSEGGSASDVAAAFQDALPLTDIEGIDLYDRTRLASEGVTNIEALAHHDLVELMLQTRIPVPRLVDWTDQAILHLHVCAADRAKLRTYGIRTATDLLETRNRARERGEEDDFLAILDEQKPERMQVVLDAMEDEEWMANLLSWHRGIGPQNGAPPPRSDIPG